MIAVENSPLFTERLVGITLTFALFLTPLFADPGVRLAHASEIVGYIHNVILPEVEYQDTPLDEALEFAIDHFNTLDFDDGPPYIIKTEVKLPEAMRARLVTLKASNITIKELLMKLTPDNDISIMIFPGKIVITEANPTKG